MTAWRGPVGRVALKYLSFIWAIFAVGVCMSGLLLVRWEDVWDFLRNVALLGALWLGLPSLIAWFHFRRVWSSVFRWYARDQETVVRALTEALGAEPEQGVFRVGKTTVLVKGDKRETAVFVGPLREGAEVARLKGLVDMAMG